MAGFRKQRVWFIPLSGLFREGEGWFSTFTLGKTTNQFLIEGQSRRGDDIGGLGGAPFCSSGCMYSAVYDVID